MTRFVKIAAILSFAILSTFFLFLAFVLIRDTLPFTGSTDDFFFIFESAVCVGVAVWSIIAVVGIALARQSGRVSAVWLGPVAIVAYVMPLARYVYLVTSAPDVGWSWAALLPLFTIVLFAAWWLVLFTRPSVKRSFSSSRDHSS
jgi:hypothetical protein